MDSDTSYDSFLKYQEAGLVASKVPKRLWPTLYEKIVSQTFDAGSAFVLSEVDEGTKSAGPSEYKVLAKEEIDIQQKDTIWLIDHGYTFQYRDAAKEQIESNPELKSRLTSLMNLEEETSSDEISESLWLWAQIRVSAIFSTLFCLNNVPGLINQNNFLTNVVYKM